MGCLVFMKVSCRGLLILLSQGPSSRIGGDFDLMLLLEKSGLSVDKCRKRHKESENRAVEKQGDMCPRMLRQNIVKIRGIQLGFLFAFYLSYFHMFLYYFLSLKKLLIFCFKMVPYGTQGVKRLTLNS